MLPLTIIGVSTGLFGLLKRWSMEIPRRGGGHTVTLYKHATIGTGIFKHFPSLIGHFTFWSAIAILIFLLYQWVEEARRAIRLGAIVRYQKFDLAMAVVDRDRRRIIVGIHEKNPFKIHVFQIPLGE